MKKIVFALALVLTSGSLFAQEEVAKDSIKDGWKRGGNVLMTFNQSAFNNEWTAGGIGNIAANILGLFSKSKEPELSKNIGGNIIAGKIADGTYDKIFFIL